LCCWYACQPTAAFKVLLTVHVAAAPVHPPAASVHCPTPAACSQPPHTLIGAEEVAETWAAVKEARAAYHKDLLKVTTGDAAAGALGGYVCKEVTQ
jgi:hypothetical protein